MNQRIIRLGPLLVVLALIVGCADKSSPDAAIEGFLGGLNSSDWKAMKSHMAKEALEQIPSGAEEVQLRSELFARLEGLGGRVEYTIERTNVEGDRAQALVSGTVIAPVLQRKITQVVTFYLVREEGAWKLLPKLGVGDSEYENAVDMLRFLIASPK